MNGKKLGIIGGGQLGRMMAVEAIRLGIGVTVLDPAETPPAVAVGANHHRADLSDVQALKTLFASNDFVTWEIEHISVDALREAVEAETSRAKVSPSLDTLAVIQDKFDQKMFLQGEDIPVPAFAKISGEKDLLAFKEHQSDIIVKTRKGGYDGRGNYVVVNEVDCSAVFTHFPDAELYVEALQSLAQEVSVIVAKGVGGQISVYDPVDMVHYNNICHTVSAPSQISQKLKERCFEVSEKVIQKMDGQGVFAIELFITTDDEVLVNEIAPRVHNSGHHTIEACETNQFEQHVRAVTDLPLGSPRLTVDSVVMMNLLGSEDKNHGFMPDISGALEDGAHVHWYGKSPISKERKMGHMTFIREENETMQMLLERAISARKKISL